MKMENNYDRRKGYTEYTCIHILRIYVPFISLFLCVETLAVAAAVAAATLETSTTTAFSISPAFEWAQSGDWIYINAKMSHKIDAPATLNVVSEGVDMSERSLRFSASKDHKRFSLDLALHADIDPDVRKHKKTGKTKQNKTRDGALHCLALCC